MQVGRTKTEKTNFDELSEKEVGKLFPIWIESYDPNWEMLYEQEKALITKTLREEDLLNIEHFGSTSVLGLASKPTIDILVEVSKLNDAPKQSITQKLEAIGYRNMHNAEKENKMTFGKGYDENYARTQTYHLHIREKGNSPQDEILFRDYLRKNSDIRDQYAALKYTLAEKHQFNREDYTRGKTDFIKRITEHLLKK